MALLFKAASTAGTITVETRDGMPPLVTIKKVNAKTFGTDKVTSVSVSGFMLRTVTITLLSGEKIELKSMVQKDAEALQKLLS